METANVVLNMKPAVKSKASFAYEVECTEKDTRHWMHPWCVDKNGGQLALLPPILVGKGLEATVPNLVKESAKKNPKNKCMGIRKITCCTMEESEKGKKVFWQKGPYVWRTYEEVYHDIENAAKGLLKLVGDKRQQKKQVIAALLAETSQEWKISAQAALAGGITLTTVYATLGHEAMLHGLQQTEAEIIFIDWGLFRTLKDAVLAKCPALRHIIFIGKDFIPEKTEGGKHDPFPSPEEAAALPPIGAAYCTTLDNVIAHGKDPKNAPDLAAVAPTAKDVALIMYTSGSTGLPKGVVLTHQNFVSVVASAIVQKAIIPTENDVTIAYLPLAHIMELLVETACLSQGAALGYGHPRTLTSTSPYIKTTGKGIPEKGYESDLVSLRPTLMVAVPAILDLITSGLKKKVSGMGIVGKIIAGGIARKMGEKSAGCGICACLDGVLISKVKTALGLDRVRLLISGGAPLSKDTQEYIQAVFAPVAQGYGSTETSACATVQECFANDGRPQDTGGGRVGACQPANEIKLVSVPDMGYLVTDDPPRGEILVSGNNVSEHGYYKMPEETGQAFIRHADGKLWFHTGDVGVMEKDGVLKIVDRKKDLIKLQGGEYVSLGKVEAMLKAVPGIAACCLFAQSDKTFCVCIVSQPEKGWPSVGGRPDQLDLLKNIKETMKGKLSTFEIPTKVELDDTIWTPETGLVTASMKIQRNEIRKFYNKPGGLLEKMQYKFPDK